MLSATFFGEIAELDSRAVWYSDEEDEEDDNSEFEAKAPAFNPIVPVSHETIRAGIQLNFLKTAGEIRLNFTSCVISLSSQYKNVKLTDASMIYLGNFDSLGKAFAYSFRNESSNSKNDGYMLWLLLDSTHRYLVGHEVGYVVEMMREKLQTDFQLHGDSQIIVLSRTFSRSEDLEYLVNYLAPLKQPFNGRPISPPSLITNQFESSLFEQLTLSLRPAVVVCLPDPKNFWFDKSKDWPTIPNQIIETKLRDDNLDKTLIFT